MNIYALMNEVSKRQNQIVRECVAELTDKELLGHVETIRSMVITPAFKVAKGSKSGLEGADDNPDLFQAIYEEAEKRKLISVSKSSGIIHAINDQGKHYENIRELLP